MKTYSNVPHAQEGTIEVPCAVCGSEQRDAYWNLPDYSYVRCVQCHHVYQFPQPDLDALENRYTQHYFEYEKENATLFLDLMLQGLHDINIDYYIHQYTRTHHTPLSFLDIGCATGALLEYYQHRGWRVQGVEICKEAAQWGMRTRKVPIYIGDVLKAQFPPSSFTLVHASHLIEHVPNPLRLLEECHQLLAADGYLVLVTPDRAGLQAKLFGPRWRSVIADHLHLFDYSHLKMLAHSIGFRSIRKCSWGGIGKGITVPWIKKLVDWGAKKTNIGDVMLALFQK